MIESLITVVLVILLTWIAGAVIYLITGFGKRIYHDIMGWHKPSGKQSFDGISVHDVCKYCGKDIMQDSQGNWF